MQGFSRRDAWDNRYTALGVWRSEEVSRLGLRAEPVSAWRGWAHERRWGFSTQSLGAWLVDSAKGFSVAAALTALGVVALVGSARVFRQWWPAVAAAAAAALVLVLTVLAPLLFERVFNRFWPLPDERLARELYQLSERAGVRIRAILLADASRRTHKQNAYVSGLGPTRRLVLFDTLVDQAQADELRGLVAHELGHCRFRHGAFRTLFAMVGAVAAVLAFRAVDGWNGVVAAVGANWAADPAIVPLALLVFWLLTLGTLPFESWLSRRWERQADYFALEFTDDGAALERMYRRLALANLADLDPPRLMYALVFTHPTPPERIAAARTGSYTAPGRGAG